MRNRKHDIERYLRGELSPAEMHALEKAALNDPFLAEALEGVEQAGADNFLYDLHALNRKLHDRTRHRKDRTIRIWGWTAGMAAAVLLVAVSGFLVVSILNDQRAEEQAMNKQPSPVPENAASTDSAAVGPHADDAPQRKKAPVLKHEPIADNQPPSSRGSTEAKPPLEQAPTGESIDEPDKPIAQGYEENDSALQSTPDLGTEERTQEVVALSDIPTAARARKKEASTATENGGEALFSRPAEPRGGQINFKEYLSQAVKYPEEALRDKIEGWVTVRFTVEPDGRLTNFELVESISSECDQELIRVIREGPRWEPGTRGDVPVRDSAEVRFEFKLPE